MARARSLTVRKTPRRRKTAAGMRQDGTPKTRVTRHQFNLSRQRKRYR
jgi:hypothetical protein